MTLLEFYRSLRARRRCDTGSILERTLVLDTGVLIVAPDGITAKLRPPFSKLSRHYPWQMVPPSFAALRVLASDECDAATTRMVERALGLGQSVELSADPLRRCGPDLRDCDQRALEETDTWLGDVERIVRWGVGLADVCPYASVARDLAMLPRLQPADLDRYVHAWLG